LLAGLALAATSVAIVYTSLMEFVFSKTNFGKTILKSILSRIWEKVIGLGLVFAPFIQNRAIFCLHHPPLLMLRIFFVARAICLQLGF
jgi:glutathione-regulated potassium-efflux system ancillary protein KefC